MILGFLILAGSVHAQQHSFEVRTIYFKPADIAQDTAKVQRLMKDAQDFFRDEMERYGFGQKTFRLDPVTHVVRGRFNLNHYIAGTWDKVRQELPAQFHDQNDIYAVFLAGANLIDGVWGFGWPIYGWGNGGVALMAENAPIGVDLVVHELLHTFGLYHEIPAIIPEFQEVKYRWLDKHHYFNNIFEIRDVPSVHSVDIKGVIKDQKYVQFHVAVSSRIGLHQSLLWRAYDWGIVGWDVEVSGLSDTSIIEVPHSWLSETDGMWFQILDIHGNHWMHAFNYDAPDFEPSPTSVQEDTRLSITWAELKGK